MSKKIQGAELTQAMPAITKSTATETKQDPLDDYEVKDHLDTLMKAHRIMNDAGKMGKVHALAGRHKKAIRSIQDIQDHYNLKFGPRKKTDLGELGAGADMDDSGA